MFSTQSCYAHSMVIVDYSTQQLYVQMGVQLVDVVVLSNGPGEVAGWVRPAVRALRKRFLASSNIALRISVRNIFSRNRFVLLLSVLGHTVHVNSDIVYLCTFVGL